MTMWISGPDLWRTVCTSWGFLRSIAASPPATSTNVIRSLWTKILRPRFLCTGVSRVSRETGDSVDGHNALEPVTLRHVDTGDWRYGQEGDDRPWTEPLAGTGPSGELWTDDGAAEAWTPTSPSSWRPRHQADPTGSSTISPTPIGPESDNGSYGSPAGGYGAQAGAYPSGGFPIRGYSTGYTTPPRYGVVSSAPTSGAAAFGSAEMYGGTGQAFGSASVTGSASGSFPVGGPATGSAMVRRPGLAPGDPQARSAPGRRGEDEPRRLARIPDYLKVLWFTAAWYAGALVLYLLWLVIAGGDREAVAGRQFVAGLPWMFVAILVSGALATGLRRLTVGWGAIGVSFAAAVIGAGLATIIHSFA